MAFFDPALAIFSGALLIMAMIALLEVFGLLFGVAFSELLDSVLPDFDVDIDVDADVDGIDTPDLDGVSVFAQVLGWLCVGRVPVLILIAIFLTAFGLSGLIAQNVLQTTVGTYFPAWIVSIGAFALALPVTRHIGLVFAKVMPKEETDAVSTDTFIGRAATIIRGEAKAGKPAEAKLTDGKGTTQYILVEPDRSEVTFSEGSSVLLVSKEGALFKAILNTEDVV